MNEKYKNLATPPKDATKKIEAGKLKGKTDINPQWKIEAMTNEFGLCGIGWKFQITDKNVYPCASGEVLLFMEVGVQVKEGEVWGEPAYGCGGDFIIQKNKNGLVANDEAYKMCLTDALGNAFKYFGVGADVYRGVFDSKHNRPIQNQPQNTNKDEEEKKTALHKLAEEAKKKNCLDKIPTIIKAKFGKNSSKEMTAGEINYLLANLDKFIKEDVA